MADYVGLGVELGLLMGGIGALAMMFASAAITYVVVSGNVIAMVQNFAAGLIIGAVGVHLIPIILYQATSTASMAGITIGFTLGLALLYGVEFLTHFAEVKLPRPSTYHSPRDEAASNGSDYREMIDEDDNRSTISRISEGLKGLLESRKMRLPWSLIFPVIVDCIVCGFLVGVACGISSSGGIVLGIANALESAAVGMAYAPAVDMCSGVTQCARRLTIYLPPIVMFLVSGLAAYIGEEARKVPVIYITLVSFGVIALIFLTTNELLVTARQNQGKDPKWYVNLCIFAGFYVILMLSHAFGSHHR